MADNKKNDEIFEFMLQQAFEKYAEDMEDEPVPELSEEAYAHMLESKQRVYKNVMKRVKQNRRTTRPKSIKKIIYLVAVISVIGVLFAANATAFKSFLYKTYTNVEGNVMKISADYSDFDRRYAEITEFAYKDELIVPGWMPNEARLVGVQDAETFVVCEYKINGNFLNILEENIDFNDNYSEEQLENNRYKDKKIKILGMDAYILEMGYESEVKGITAVWCSDNVQYTIKTDLSFTALTAIMKDLKYYQ